MAALYSQNGAIVRQVASFTGEMKLVNIMPTTGVKVVDDNGYIGGDYLGVYYPSTNYYNNFAIQLVGADFSNKGLGQVTIVDSTATIGGRVYRTVTIGGVTWTAENLDYKFSGCGIGGSGTPTTPNAWYYNNDEATYGIDGVRKCSLLYNGYAVKLLNDNRADLIPGWHVATSGEWDALANAVGGTGVAGIRLKADNVSWATSWGGTNDYGFEILPAGFYTGSFQGVGIETSFWTSTAYSNDMLYIRQFAYHSDSMYDSRTYRKYVYPVRLVKDSA